MVGGTGKPTAEDFRAALNRRVGEAESAGRTRIEVKSGDLHREVGGYPADGRHHMPLCCAVMRQAMRAGDEILPGAPPSGQGATLVVRYRLPR